MSIWMSKRDLDDVRPKNLPSGLCKGTCKFGRPPNIASHRPHLDARAMMSKGTARPLPRASGAVAAPAGSPRPPGLRSPVPDGRRRKSFGLVELWWFGLAEHWRQNIAVEW